MNSPFQGRAATTRAGHTESADGGDHAGLRAGRRAARVKRGMFLLPSLFTAGSIGLGFYAITQTMDSLSAVGNADGPSHLNTAAKAICFAIPFDALDGRIARMTNTASDFGKELDSLADAITFGVAPALLAWVWGFHSLPEAANPQLHTMILQIGSFVCFLYLLCGVSRLARFNISHDPQPRNPGRLDRKYFVGMPIPAAAGMVAATVHFCSGFPIPKLAIAIPWIGLVGLLGFLMVSTWRFWSGKEINLSGRQPFQLLALFAIVAFVLGYFSSETLFFVALVYLFSGLWARAAYGWQRKRRQMVGGDVDAIPPRSATPFRSEYEQHLAVGMVTRVDQNSDSEMNLASDQPRETRRVAPIHPVSPIAPNHFGSQSVASGDVARTGTAPVEAWQDEPEGLGTAPDATAGKTGPTAAEIEWARVREAERLAEIETRRKLQRETRREDE